MSLKISAMTESTLTVLMDLVFEHKREISEKNYIDICNKLKHDYNNENKIQKSIFNRLDKLHREYELLLKEHDNISKPNINNSIKYTAAYLLAKKHKLTYEYIQVDLLSFHIFSDINPVKCLFYTHRKIDDVYLNLFFTCLHDEYDINKRSIASTKDVKEITEKVLQYTKNNNELKEMIEKVREYIHVNIQNKFYNDRMKSIVEETEYLSTLLEIN